MTTKEGLVNFNLLASFNSDQLRPDETEESWKNRIRKKIENDLSSQVAQALAPLKSQRKMDEPKSHHDIYRNDRNFKYINSNFTRQRRLFADFNKITKSYGNKMLSSQSFTKLCESGSTELLSRSMYQFDALKRRKRNIHLNEGLNFALVDAGDTLNFFRFRQQQNGLNGLKPLTSEEAKYHPMSIPDYGINRNCFQSYTKEGTNNLLASRSRRNRLKPLGNGKYLDKRGIIISRKGPFWPHGIGPVCQSPEFIFKCQSQENLGTPYTELMKKSSNLPILKQHPGTFGSRDLTGGWEHNKRHPVKTEWRGKHVIFDCDRHPKAPLVHSTPEGFDESLIFESRFESGNLRQVRRIKEFEYELVLRTDMYTNRHTQWYYFRIEKAKKDRTYKFNIVNFLKKDSLYNYGMRPLVYSEELAKDEERGWFRCGDNIRYISWNNPTRNSLLSLDLQYFCLEMEVSFNWENVEEDTIYMAHCYPYTYSDLRRHLNEVVQCPIRSCNIRKEVLCETAAGNPCYLLTITNFEEDLAKNDKSNIHKNKKGVVITARVHPGETQASWMMKGVFDFLTSSHSNAIKLRSKYIFKIVPMLNPDGVIVGNYRTSLSARDLNRNYRHPRVETFPTIWYTKQMVDEFSKSRQIVLYCDLHGHSRKHLVFMYGCERRLKPNKDSEVESRQDSFSDAQSFVEERLFPWLMHRLTPTRFSFHETKFSIRRSKESTGRVVMFKQMGIQNSFTLEASFSGIPKGRHFNIDDFLMIGRKLCESLLEYSRLHEDPLARSRVIIDMTKELVSRTEQLAVKNKPISDSDEKSEDQIKRAESVVKGSYAHNLLSQSMSSLRSSSMSSVKSSCKMKGSIDQSIDEKKMEIKASIESDKNCFELLQSLQVFQIDDDSESSCESNSDSEPELPRDHVLPSQIIKPRKSLSNASNIKKKKRKKNKSQKQMKESSVSNKNYLQPPKSIQENDNFHKIKSQNEEVSMQNRTKTSTYSGFISKYANRSNGGIPIFAQERIQERAARRMAEMKLIEEERRQHQRIREEFILSGIQNIPMIPHKEIDRRTSVEDQFLSDLCGVRYNISSKMRRSHSLTSSYFRDCLTSEPSDLSSRRLMINQRTYKSSNKVLNRSKKWDENILTSTQLPTAPDGKEPLLAAQVNDYNISRSSSGSSKVSSKSSDVELKTEEINCYSMKHSSEKKCETVHGSNMMTQIKKKFSTGSKPASNLLDAEKTEKLTFNPISGSINEPNYHSPQEDCFKLSELQQTLTDTINNTKKDSYPSNTTKPVRCDLVNQVKLKVNTNKDTSVAFGDLLTINSTIGGNRKTTGSESNSSSKPSVTSDKDENLSHNLNEFLFKKIRSKISKSSLLMTENINDGISGTKFGDN